MIINRHYWSLVLVKMIIWVIILKVVGRVRQEVAEEGLVCIEKRT